MRRAVLWLHRWIGLSIGLVIAFLGLSGALLVFRPELDARLNPQLLRVEPQSEPLAWQAGFESVRTAYPERKLSFYFAPQAADRSGEYWLDGGELRVYVDPYNGKILGTRGETEGFYPWLYHAHTKLFIGDAGEKLAGWSGLFLIAIAVSGLILWFPRSWNSSTRRRLLVPQLKTNWKGRIYELHRAVGFYLCALFLISGVTGAALVFPDSATLLLSPLGTTPKPKSPKIRKAKWRDLGELVHSAQKAFPAGQVTRLTFPAKSSAPLTVRLKTPEERHPNGLNNVALDPGSGKVLWVSLSSDVPRGQKLFNARYHLHLGLWGGNFSRVLQSMAGLSLPLFYFSGLWMWWNRRRKAGERSR